VSYSLGGKQGLVELFGASSTINGCAPEINKVNSIYKKSFRLSRIISETPFCFKGILDGKNCVCKIDTGSDVSILNRNMVERSKSRILVKDCCLRSPTGEEVPILFKVGATVNLGKCSEKRIPMLVADISDECILGIDFLEKTICWEFLIQFSGVKVLKRFLVRV